MNLYINNQNIIYHEKPIYEEARELTQEETALYYRGYGYKIEEGVLVDISQAEEYLLQEVEKQKNLNKEMILEEIKNLDQKRIRAICEPSFRDDGQSWLEYYTSEIQKKRLEFGAL